MTSQPAAPPPLALDTSPFFRLYAAGQHEQLAQAFLNVLGHFSKTAILSPDVVRTQVTPFVQVFLTLFAQSDFTIPGQTISSFLLSNPLLANLTAMSPWRTTDAFLETVLHQPANLVKILTLYSARNTLRISRRLIFDANPHLASLWYNLFCEAYKASLVRPDVVQHLTEHLTYQDERMALSPGISIPYFCSTYVEGTRLDRTVKPFINRVVRAALPVTARATGEGDHREEHGRRVAVISDYWYAGHSVYRNYAAYVKELKKAYHLTFFHTSSSHQEFDTSMFDEVQRLEREGGPFRLDPFRARAFDLAYFPDVGMTLPSIILANCRLAPIQICSPGHSVSTWGANIDYYLSGADVEIKDCPERNYSERLVLLPGLGVIHDRPNYEPCETRRVSRTEAPAGEVVVNCPWSAQKICARFLTTVRQLIDRAGVPLRLRVFAAEGISEHNAHFNFLADSRAALGTAGTVNLEVFPQLDYRQFMGLMEEGDLTLDCFHFAGCNSVADSLFVRKPTVVWEGDKWYNRIGPALLRLVGLDECIATTEEEYLDKALLLIRDGTRRARVAAQLQRADLDATIFSTEHAPAFCRAVDFLLAHHEQLSEDRSRKPIVIE